MAHAASNTRCRRRSKPARPYIWRLIVFRRLICPSTGLVLQGSASAARTAARSRRRLSAKATQRSLSPSRRANHQAAPAAAHAPCGGSRGRGRSASAKRGGPASRASTKRRSIPSSSSGIGHHQPAARRPEGVFQAGTDRHGRAASRAGTVGRSQSRTDAGPAGKAEGLDLAPERARIAAALVPASARDGRHGVRRCCRGGAVARSVSWPRLQPALERLAVQSPVACGDAGFATILWHAGRRSRRTGPAGRAARQTALPLGEARRGISEECRTGKASFTGSRRLRPPWWRRGGHA